MPSRQVTAVELKAIDERQFYKEYWDWCSYCLPDDWSSCVEAEFKKELAPFGVDVDSVAWEGLGGGSYPQAAFSGRVEMSPFMRHYKVDGVPLSEMYPALYLAVWHDESWASVHYTSRLNFDFDMHEYTDYVAPAGLFSQLDEVAWRELVVEQWAALDVRTTLMEFLKDRAHDFARRLEAEYEGYTSEEAFIESCECNEVTFEIEIDEEIEDGIEVCSAC